MTRESLQSIPLEELAARARSEGYDLNGSVDRAALTEFILETLTERARERQEENSSSVRVEGSKYEIVEGECPESVNTDRFPIPERYDRTKIVFMVRDPHWAFAYWDLEEKAREKTQVDEESRQLVLRVHEGEIPYSGKSEDRNSFDIPIQPGDSRWYIYLPEPNRSYTLELVLIIDDKNTRLAVSNTIRTPRDSLIPNAAESHLEASLNPLFDFDESYLAGSSGDIPQRILAAGSE